METFETGNLQLQHSVWHRQDILNVRYFDVVLLPNYYAQKPVCKRAYYRV
jgi:hypothetical protein